MFKSCWSGSRLVIGAKLQKISYNTPDWQPKTASFYKKIT